MQIKFLNTEKVFNCIVHIGDTNTHLWISFYGAYLSSFHKLFHSPRLAFFYYNILHVLTGEMWELVFKTETVGTIGSLVLTPYRE